MTLDLSFVILSWDALYLHRLYEDFPVSSLGSSYSFYRHVIKEREVIQLAQGHKTK